MIKNPNVRIKKRSFLLLEILLALGLFLSILPFVFKQFARQKVFLEEKIIELQIWKIKEESLFLIEREIKEMLSANPSQLKEFHSKLNQCSQKIISSKKRLLDVFYEYKVTKFCEYNKQEGQQKGVLIGINMSLLLPKKKRMTVERSLFFGYEAS